MSRRDSNYVLCNGPGMHPDTHPFIIYKKILFNLLNTTWSQKLKSLGCDNVYQANTLSHVRPQTHVERVALGTTQDLITEFMED